MFESFVTALIIYVVVIIDPIGNATIFLAVTGAQHGTRKLCTALEANTIMLFFAPYRALDPRLSRHHRGRLQDCRRHNLFIVALNMLAAKRQQRKRAKITPY